MMYEFLSSEGIDVTVHTPSCLKFCFKLAALYFTYNSFSYQNFVFDYTLTCNLHTVEVLFPNIYSALKKYK